jgi:hypothetical protein
MVPTSFGSAAGSDADETGSAGGGGVGVGVCAFTVVVDTAAEAIKRTNTAIILSGAKTVLIDLLRAVNDFE